jgi:hypothetical protein
VTSRDGFSNFDSRFSSEREAAPDGIRTIEDIGGLKGAVFRERPRTIATPAPTCFWDRNLRYQSSMFLNRELDTGQADMGCCGRSDASRSAPVPKYNDFRISILDSRMEEREVGWCAGAHNENPKQSNRKSPIENRK